MHVFWTYRRFTVRIMEKMLNKSSSSSGGNAVSSMKRSRPNQQPPMAMFQTAGSGKSIEVSEEKVKEMEKMLTLHKDNNSWCFYGLTVCDSNDLIC